jgi:uncharacterized membrane protein
MDAKSISLYIMAALYILAGINHFINPRLYLKITPPWVPAKELTNYFVGLVEIVLGVLVLIPASQSLAAWGIIALLVAVFPANIYHFQKARQKNQAVIPTLIRLPIQALLIWWAYLYV